MLVDRLAIRFAPLAARAALIGGSLASGSLFWVRAALGENQLRMHDCTPDGSISIGGVPEQLYGEGFLAAWHEVLGRELGPRLPAVLYEVGRKGGRWEAQRAIDRGVWVPRLMKGLVGRPEMLEKVRSSPVFNALVKETLKIFFRMIITEGGWGVVDEIDMVSNPVRLTLSNGPEPRRLGHTGRCSCHLTTGIAAGYFEALLGAPCVAKETTCVSRGDDVCTFEMSFVPAPAAAPEKGVEARVAEVVGRPGL